MKTFTRIEDVIEAQGAHLGESDWRTIDQERIDLFARATGDHQWIHVDPERARASSFGSTIAHGYLTLSLLSDMTADVVRYAFDAVRLNYGVDRVRFLAPVPVDSRVRDSVDVAKVESTPSGVRVTYRHTVEIDGSPRPACIAETISLIVT
ncbi:MAG: MaoC family dehydratase [Microbacterium sp.]